jgi:signal transduction histidine kinase
MTEDAAVTIATSVALDDQAEILAFLDKQEAPHSHIVQFYEDESALVDNVVHFVTAGLRENEPVVIIATEHHRVLFGSALSRAGVDLGRLAAAGEITMLDARATLAQFMEDDEPSSVKFEQVIGAVIEQVLRGRPTRVRAYGEMVDLLWRDGKRSAAVQLEQLWNDLAEHHAFTLLCAYVMGNFIHSDDAEMFDHVCKTHSHIIPCETISRLDGERRSRHIAALEQRARSLENEIVHRQQLEAALREALAREKAAREEAERNIRYNEMFAGMLGHDLRNPLGTITMGANYIARVNVGEKPTRAATRILASAERMSRMIDQLLDFTSIRIGGGLELNLTRIDLAEVCERVKEELEAGNPQCHIQLAARGNTSGLWDYDRLLQVFSNLVGNAVSHGSAGCEVSIQADGTDSSDVIAEVRNAGAIEPEILPSIFEPFRGGKKRHKAKGLGLGLFITRQIVVAHSGSIDVASSDIQGTTVRVRLPRFPPVFERSRVQV